MKFQQLRHVILSLLLASGFAAASAQEAIAGKESPSGSGGGAGLEFGVAPISTPAMPDLLPLPNTSYVVHPSQALIVKLDALLWNAGDGNQHPLPQQPSASSDTAPCPEPAHLFSIRDYDGPMKKSASRFSPKRDARHGDRDKGCSLDASEKFALFARSTINPLTYVTAAYNAGIAQVQNNDPTFGQGAEGYGKRYGAALTDQFSRSFFRKFAYPVIFRQDPRYFRRGEGTAGQRIGHAVSHVFIIHSDEGNNMFNFSEWFGTTSAVALGNLYHPGHERGFTPAARRVGISIGTDMGMDVLREFWPQVTRALRLPFHESHSAPPSMSSNTDPSKH